MQPNQLGSRVFVGFKISWVIFEVWLNWSTKCQSHQAMFVCCVNNFMSNSCILLLLIFFRAKLWNSPLSQLRINQPHATMRAVCYDDFVPLCWTALVYDFITKSQCEYKWTPYFGFIRPKPIEHWVLRIYRHKKVEKYTKYKVESVKFAERKYYLQWCMGHPKLIHYQPKGKSIYIITMEWKTHNTEKKVTPNNKMEIIFRCN